MIERFRYSGVLLGAALLATVACSGSSSGSGAPAAGAPSVAQGGQPKTNRLVFAVPPPPAPLPQTGFGDIESRTGAQGRVREELPPAGPCDLWWIYDPRVEYIVR